MIRLDPSSVSRLERARESLCRDSHPKRICPRLQSQAIFDDEDSEWVMIPQMKRERMERLITRYKEKALNLDTLILILREIGDWHVAQIMETTSTGALTDAPWAPSDDNARGWLNKGKVPPRPPGFVERPAVVEELRRRMGELRASGEPWTLFLHGMAGCGKTTLAAEALREKDFVWELCGGMVRWLKVGSNGAARELALLTDLWSLLEKKEAHLGPDAFSGAQSKARLLEHIQDAIQSRYPHLLIVLDDIVSDDILQTFQEIKCGTLVTTRNIYLAKKVATLNQRMTIEPQTFSKREAYRLLQLRTGLSELPVEWEEMASATGGHPLVLSILASLLAEGDKADPAKGFWGFYALSLRNQRKDAISAPTNYPQPSLEVVMALALKDLETNHPTLYHDYVSLAIFPLDVPIPDSVAGVLWAGNASEPWSSHKVLRVQGALDALVGRSLLTQLPALETREEPENARVRDRVGSYPSSDRITSYSYEIHRMLHQFLKRSMFTTDIQQLLQRKALVKDLEDALAKSDHPDHAILERHFYQCLGYHLFKAELWEAFARYYLDLEKLSVMLRYVAVKDIITDFIIYRKWIGKWDNAAADAFRDFLRGQSRQLGEFELVQLALMEPPSSPVHKNALRLRKKDGLYFLPDRSHSAGGSGGRGWRLVQEILLGLGGGLLRGLDPSGLFFVLAPSDKAAFYVYNGELSRAVETRRLPSPAIALTVCKASQSEWEILVSCGGPEVLLYTVDLGRLRKDTEAVGERDSERGGGNVKTPSPIQRFLSEAMLQDRDEDFSPPEAALPQARFRIPPVAGRSKGPGPERATRDCAASRDGSFVAAATEDGGVFLFNAMDTKLRHTLEEGRRPPSDGRGSESSQDDVDARTPFFGRFMSGLSTRTPSPAGSSASPPPPGFSGPAVGLLAFCPASRFVAVGWQGLGKVRIFETSTGQLHGRLTHVELSLRPVFVDSTRLATGDHMEILTAAESAVQQWRLPAKEGSRSGAVMIRELKCAELDAKLSSMCASRDFVVTGWDDFAIRMHSLSEGVLVACLCGHSGSVSSVVTFPDMPQLLLSAGEDHFISMWDTGQLERKASWETLRVGCVAVAGTSADGIVTADEMGNIRARPNFPALPISPDLNANRSPRGDGRPNGTGVGPPPRRVTCLACARDAIVTGHEGGEVRIHQLSGGGEVVKLLRCLGPKVTHLKSVRGVSVSSDGSRLVAWGDETKLIIDSVKDSRPRVLSLKRSGNPVAGLWIGPDFVFASGQGLISIARESVTAVEEVGPSPGVPLTALAGRGSELLAVGTAKGSLSLLSFPKLGRIHTSPSNGIAISALAIADQLLAIGDVDGGVKLLSIRRPENPETVYAAAAVSAYPVSRLAFARGTLCALSDRLCFWPTEAPPRGRVEPASRVPLPGGSAKDAVFSGNLSVVALDFFGDLHALRSLHPLPGH